VNEGLRPPTEPGSREGRLWRGPREPAFYWSKVPRPPLNLIPQSGGREAAPFPYQGAALIHKERRRKTKPAVRALHCSIRIDDSTFLKSRKRPHERPAFVERAQRDNRNSLNALVPIVQIGQFLTAYRAGCTHNKPEMFTVEIAVQCLCAAVQVRDRNGKNPITRCKRFRFLRHNEEKNDRRRDEH
jgi:hypothetical protein